MVRRDNRPEEVRLRGHAPARRAPRGVGVAGAEKPERSGKIEKAFEAEVRQGREESIFSAGDRPVGRNDQ